MRNRVIKFLVKYNSHFPESILRDKLRAKLLHGFSGYGSYPDEALQRALELVVYDFFNSSIDKYSRTKDRTTAKGLIVTEEDKNKALSLLKKFGQPNQTRMAILMTANDEASRLIAKAYWERSNELSTTT